ncbi:beta class carbonic anhydrase [Aaosphaeria arxii CBS 175.79]|uniref:Carbonic anhydrase n=1 Tax=Aaosphaeria arxii CBS 175.79 TaxID=1450172 RepID=A0A6A5X8A5_9PLEO|nr:beta class carbonic anhydrase [Aaosphaeria arxii CBS 175.79]KAF2009146.1 beta class carbonic anhydrase [Aaosphaeria arxii CBS 175.79]
MAGLVRLSSRIRSLPHAGGAAISSLPRASSSHLLLRYQQLQIPSSFSSPSTPLQLVPSIAQKSTFSSSARANCPRKMTEQSKELRKYLQQSHDKIFESNRKWAEEQRAKNPEFFEKLSAGQSPDYLWIGCSDSRIPAEAITGLGPGEMFIHRNIANLVCNLDLNVMSVVNYAVRHLKVKHIVVCGHYGCGGVKAAMAPQDLGLLNPWLRNIRDVYRLHEKELDALEGDSRYDRLVELNVVEQCRNIIKTAAVQQSYEANEFPIVHGWVFGLNDGLLKDLKVDHEAILHDVQKIYNLTK